MKKEREEVGRRVQSLMPFDSNYEAEFGVLQAEGRLGEGGFGLPYFDECVT